MYRWVMPIVRIQLAEGNSQVAMADLESGLVHS